jgi:hypothetical protein
MNDFIEGDIVRIVCVSGDWPGYYWAPEMNAAVGKEGTILSFRGEGNCSICVPGIRENYVYPRTVLELVTHRLPGHGPNNTHLAQELPR